MSQLAELPALSMHVPGIIIGGGIAGLTAAVALQQRGIAVKVCESAPEILPLGAGIWMAPNAMQVFQRLGLAEKINAAGVPLHNIQIVDGQMRPILRTSQERIRQRFGHTTTAIKRARLQALLLAEIAPADVLLAKTCVSLREVPQGVNVAFADGTTITAGFVIAADGIHSAVRAQLFPSVRFAGTGHVVWRGMTEIQLAPVYKRSITEAWAGGVRFGFSEVADGLVDWFVVVKATPADADHHGLKSRLHTIFQGFAYPIPAILEATDETRIIRNEIADFDPIPQWSRGRVCLIGDAAHASTPYMGQGGCQAVEDAYAIAQCLHHEPTPELAFAAMQRLRRPKATSIVKKSRLMGQIGYWTGAAGALRNGLMRAAPARLVEQQFYQVYRLNY
ncbi:FAD-dependent monooxygenase [Hymenobacter terricola]|uniref:FAD-dependent monooxygenase n=1 Tax=Hymenobacter terricola TaxID=2819236 RepID=UPI001B311D26|nr:FAD-dependent monooxygenase [Hymenobacter terricola]